VQNGVVSRRPVSFPQHVARTWLADRPRLHALSPGCGTGVWEIDWARLDVFVVGQCTAAEDQALARLGPNFVLAVCRPHGQPDVAGLRSGQSLS
jgi:hypothetical protein